MTPAAIALLALPCGGCRVDLEYRWIQREDGLGMKAPIIHRVRVRSHRDSNDVEWLEEITSADSVSDRTIATYGTRDSEFSRCSVYDEQNWHCDLGFQAQVVITMDMKNGTLHRSYFGERQDFITIRSIHGFMF
jgi:hypothetical protein